MQTTVQLDAVLNLIWDAQEDLANELDQQGNGTAAYRLLWEHYKRLSGLYDDVRRVANDD